MLYSGSLQYARGPCLDYSPIGSIADQFNCFKITLSGFPSKSQRSIWALGNRMWTVKMQFRFGDNYHKALFNLQNMVFSIEDLGPTPRISLPQQQLSCGSEWVPSSFILASPCCQKNTCEGFGNLSFILVLHFNAKSKTPYLPSASIQKRSGQLSLVLGENADPPILTRLYLFHSVDSSILTRPYLFHSVALYRWQVTVS